MNQNLTKREYVAAMMLQGIIGNERYILNTAVKAAIEYADKLLTKLAEIEPQAEIEPEAHKQYPTLPEGVTVPEGYELLAYGSQIPSNAKVWSVFAQKWERTQYAGAYYKIESILGESIYCIPK